HGFYQRHFYLHGDLFRRQRITRLIDGIKILQLDGLNGGGVAGDNASAGQGGVADQAVSAALRYRSQAPVIDALMKELGIDGTSLEGLSAPLMANGRTPTNPDKDLS
ncbi:MAG: flotillin domain-containing protein, partial [Pseudomonadota bacterium]